MPGRAKSFDYEVFRSEGSGYSITFSGKYAKSMEHSHEQGYGVRVVKDKRIGFSYCDNEEDLGKAMDRAAVLARFSPQTGFCFPENAQFKKMDLVDRKIANFQPEELKGIIGQVRDGIEKHGAKARVIFDSGISKTMIENSNGFFGSYDCTGCSLYAEAMCKDGYGFTYEEGLSLPKDFSEIGERAGKMAKDMKGAKKPAKGMYTIILATTTLEDLLDVMLPSLSGDWKRKGTSILAGKAGKKVFSDNISIYDDPLAIASDARPFDDEGTISKRIPLLEKGVLRNFVYDRETAALEGIDSGGFCKRASYNAPPGASLSNTVVEGGDCKDLEQELDNYIILHSVQGTHTANTTTGDFGFEVSVAFQKEKGKEIRPVRGFLVSGNVFKLLNGNIYLEKKAQMRGSLIAPKIAFDDMQVIS